MKQRVDSLNQQFEHISDLEKIVEIIVTQPDLKVGFASSLSIEDQVLTDVIAKVKPDTRIFTLDTGRLPVESYDLLDAVQQRYPKLNIEIYFPRPEQVEPMVAEHGINLFHTSVENRKRCCHARKIEPLQRALVGLDGWMTGMRRDQSVTRGQLNYVEWDTANGLLKFNPLLNWSEADVWAYIKEHKVPYNALYDQGYRSIGCAPCSRAVPQGGEVRDGRWWWENSEHKECGLHRKG